MSAKTSEDSLRSVRDAFRVKRFQVFRDLLDRVPSPMRILDVGGTWDYWNTVGLVPNKDLQLVLLNLFPMNGLPPFCQAHIGDACDLSRFADREFDIVYSNSVISLVGGAPNQCRMAAEMRRVGKRYYLQTPNRHFPIDWRTLVPFFHFLPIKVQAWAFNHLPVGTYKRIPDKAQALEAATRVKDLSRAELETLFPGAKFAVEKWHGFAKSFAVYHGFDGGAAAKEGGVARE